MKSNWGEGGVYIHGKLIFFVCLLLLTTWCYAKSVSKLSPHEALAYYLAVADSAQQRKNPPKTASDRKSTRLNSSH